MRHRRRSGRAAARTRLAPAAPPTQPLGDFEIGSGVFPARCRLFGASCPRLKSWLLVRATSTGSAPYLQALSGDRLALAAGEAAEVAVGLVERPREQERLRVDDGAHLRRQPAAIAGGVEHRRELDEPV